MANLSFSRINAILFFISLLVGAIFTLEHIFDDILVGRYFANPQELRYEIIFLCSYLLIILFILRYGYFLAVNRIDWSGLKNDFLFLLNRRYFSPTQWLINILLFWMAVAGFVYSLAISTMKGGL